MGVKLYVNDTWDDVTAHWYGVKVLALCVIQKDSPAADHKRSYESATTQGGTNGWFWAQSKVCGSKIEIDAYLGMYHGFDNTRNGVRILIADTSIFDDNTPPDVPYLFLSWKGNVQGWPNGTYNHHRAGTITVVDLATLDFAVAEPDGVSYNKLDELEGKTVHILIGYSDGWSADWNQWASAHKDSWIDLKAEIVDDSQDLPAKFVVRQKSSVDFPAGFRVNQDVEDLPAAFTVGQWQEDLPGEIIIRRTDTDNLSSRFSVRHTATLDTPCKLISRQAGTAELPCELIVRQAGSQDLGASFDGQVSLNLPAGFTVRQWRENLSSEFITRHAASEGLLEKLIVRHPGSRELSAGFTIIRPGSTDFLGGFTARHSAPVPYLTLWRKRKLHTIKGSIDGVLTDYVVGIKVYYGAGADGTESAKGTIIGKVYCNSKCRTDFGDIRFTSIDGVTELDYWMEEKTDGVSAVFWVKIPSIPLSPNTVNIYVYYGNSSAATTSDGNATFLIFDDFDGDALDTDKWAETAGGNTAVVADSKLKVNITADTYWIDSKIAYDFPDNVEIMSYIDINGLAGTGYRCLFFMAYDRNAVIPMWGVGWYKSDDQFSRRLHGVYSLWWGAWKGAVGGDTRHAIGTRSADWLDWFVEGTQNYNDSHNAANNYRMCDTRYLRYGISGYVANNVDLFWIAVRPCTLNVPTHTAWGPEDPPYPQGLLAILDVGQDSVNLSAGFLVRQDVKDLFAQFEVGQGSIDLFAEFTVRQPGSQDLAASFDGQASLNLAAEFLVGQDSQNLLGKFSARKAGSQELAASFDGQVSLNLSAGFVVRHPDAQNLKGSFKSAQWQEDLPAKFLLRQWREEVPARFTVYEWYGNEYRATGSSFLTINLTGRKVAYRFTAADSKTVKEVTFYSLGGTGNYEFKVGLQGLSAGLPDGIWINNCEVEVTDQPGAGYNFWTLTNPVSLVKGQKYCLVVEATFADGSNSWQVRGSTPEERFITTHMEDPLSWPLGSSAMLYDPQLDVLYYSGVGWSSRSFSACFLLKYTDDEVFGNVYNYNAIFVGIYPGSTQYQRIVPLRTVTVKSLGATMIKAGSPGNLTIRLYEEATGITLATATWAPGEIAGGAYNWIPDKSIDPATLRKGVAYILHFSADAGNSSNKYDTRHPVTAGLAAWTWGGADSRWKIAPTHDMTFRMAQTGDRDREDLPASFVVGQGSVDLRAEFVVAQDSEDLPAEFISRPLASQNLLGKFISRQAGSQDLGASFDGQVSLNLGAEFIVRQPGSQDLPAKFDIQLFTPGSQNLPSEFISRQAGSQELLGELVVRQPGSQELPGEFIVRQAGSQELLAELVVRQSGSQDLLAEFVSRQLDSQELLGEFVIRRDSSQELAAGFISRQAGSQELGASFDGQVSLNLLAEFNIRQSGSQGLLGEFDVRRDGSEELAAKFITRRDDSEDLLAEFAVRQPGSQDLLGEFTSRQAGSKELLGEFISRQASSKELGASFDAQVSLNLPAEFTVRRDGSQELLGEFIVQRPGSEDLKSTFQVGLKPGSADLFAKFTVRLSDTGELSARFAIRLPWPFWTNRYWLNGVVQLDEAKISDSFLEEIITGVMDDIKTWLIAEEIGQYPSWTNIDVTPRAIRRAATYGTVASLYARNIFGPQDLVIRVAPMDAKIFTSSEAAMEYWEAMMLRVLELYLSGVGLLRIWIDTIDEDPVFTMEDIPLYTWSPDDSP